MAKKNNKKRPQQPRRGTARPIDVTVGDKHTRAFSASIENNGRDKDGAILGSNGIRWVI